VVSTLAGPGNRRARLRRCRRQRGALLAVGTRRSARWHLLRGGLLESRGTQGKLRRRRHDARRNQDAAWLPRWCRSRCAVPRSAVRRGRFRGQPSTSQTKTSSDTQDHFRRYGHNARRNYDCRMDRWPWSERAVLRHSWARHRSLRESVCDGSAFDKKRGRRLTETSGARSAR